MASLNTSSNGPTIRRSYEGVVNAPPPSGGAAASPTFGQWAVFSVSAPLANAFQPDAGKESVLKVQTTGEGELADLIDELSDGRIQFAFVRVKDPNTGLPKNVLIAWVRVPGTLMMPCRANKAAQCGEGVPERTKGYFNTHLAAVSKLLHGYHVQVTARSESALSPEGIIQKVSDASGAKYSAGDAPAPVASRPPPPVASKPVFTPTRVGGASSGFNPLARSRAAPSAQNVDEDGWGADAPPVTRSQLEKVESAYKPTKVNLADLAKQNEDATRSGPARGDTPGDVVKGGYQPIGKVDIGAIRRQAAESGHLKDDRPAPVKGAYEPIGKVDIAAIRAKASGPGGSPANISPAPTGGDDEAPKSLTERSAAFKQQPERLTSLPKPKVANKFGNAGAFTGTKPPAPAFAPKPVAASAPIGSASKTFADQGGKTPAQLWAEKKARERGLSGSSDLPPPPAAQPIASQQSGSGGWKSSYTGKSWATVQTTHTGGSNLSAQRTGEVDPPQEEAPSSPAGGVGALRDRFKEAPPMGSAAAPPPMDLSSKPNAGRAVPGLPTRPAEAERPEEEHVDVPPPPAQPRSPTPPSPDVRPSSPIRIAQPVAKSAQPEFEAPEERSPPPPMPTESISAAVSAARDHIPDEPQVEDHDPARGAGVAAAEASFGAGAAHAGGETGGRRAVSQYDYEKAEDNEIELAEGELITNIDMVDEDWWMGQNSRGETGLFPSNYVELIEDEEEAASVPAAAAPAPPAAPPAAAGSKAPTATALYDYEAAEENELSFPDGATITSIEFPDDDWWFGEFGGKSGLFPANYVQLDE
ncbi:actin binding protein [Diplodia intermedia]|uniref:Actin binding protein n=1 Tax=Diplodia intermedia TaxID=856260 RepID=A0ABR3U5B9_9PEZI